MSIELKNVSKHFGNVPAVGMKLKVSHNETDIFESKYEQLTWFENVPNCNNTRVTDNSATAGYQSCPEPWMTN